MILPLEDLTRLLKQEQIVEMSVKEIIDSFLSANEYLDADLQQSVVMTAILNHKSSITQFSLFADNKPYKIYPHKMLLSGQS